MDHAVGIWSHVSYGVKAENFIALPVHLLYVFDIARFNFQLR